MENLEKLISDADPADLHAIGGPGPLELGERAPTFAQTPRAKKRSMLATGWKTFAVGTAIAAVTAGIIIWSPWQLPMNNGPAAPAINVTETPSTESSNDDALPNMLVPAHPSVYFEDSAACNSLDLRTIRITMIDGAVKSLPDSPNPLPVVGCVDGTAAILISESAFNSATELGGTPGILIARWTDGAWSILEKDNPGTLNDKGLPLMAWPDLRGMGNFEDLDVKPDQERRIRDLGLDEKIIGKLLGPDVASWMGKEASTDFQMHRNTLLSVAHPGWQMDESMYDVAGNDFTAEQAKRPDKSENYILTFSDSRGKTVFKVMSEKYRSQYGNGQYCSENGTYRLDGESPSGVVVDAGPMKLALMTITRPDGSQLSNLGLFPEDLPAKGDACHANSKVKLDGRMLTLTQWTPNMGFKNQAERDAYVKSPEYTDAKKVASLLTFNRQNR
ncbi:hypothetical protein ACSYDW_06760 [Paeniglutamicibacter sp. R2-26]|uniref:hypothetical protein n=1 Tax=Paeniglutamicibacter sp. R2-26 TaxID=3144417 RepID=UPI003EE494CC